MEHVLDETNPLVNARPAKKKIRYHIDENGCHVCVSHKRNPKGYPMKSLKDRVVTMARYVWMMEHGESADFDEYILHACGNTACINLDHLYKSDTQGMVNKKLADGRQPRFSGLTDEQILEIKKNTTETAVELAERYHVSYSTIGNIWHERTFKYIAVDNYEEYCQKRRERLIQTRTNQLQKSQ